MSEKDHKPVATPGTRTTTDTLESPAYEPGRPAGKGLGTAAAGATDAPGSPGVQADGAHRAPEEAPATQALPATVTSTSSPATDTLPSTSTSTSSARTSATGSTGRPAPSVEVKVAAATGAAGGGGGWGKFLLRWGVRLAIVGAVLAFGAVVAVVVFVRTLEADLPDVKGLKKAYRPPQVTRIVARDGTLLANLFTERRTVVDLKDVSKEAKLAFVAAEDAHFFEHEGLNYLGILRAAVANLRAGRTRQGGSTITQQVVKNVLLHSERTYTRKLKESLLARRLEQNLSKEEILELYLNHIYFGHGRYGVEEAARYYFGKKAQALTAAEGAALAGLVASPERYSPRRNPDLNLKRRRYVLGQMLKKGFITQALHDQALDAPLRLAPAAEAESELAPEVVARARKVLKTVAGERARLGGFTITTTIDPRLQAEARKALRKTLDDYQTRQKVVAPLTLKSRRLWRPTRGAKELTAGRVYLGTVTAVDDDAGTIEVEVLGRKGRVDLRREERFNPKRLAPGKFTKVGAAMRVRLERLPADDEMMALRLAIGPEGALVAIDVRSREVLALIGSYEAVAGGLDRATQAKRQPGSTFKPFVYSYALHSRRFTPATVLEFDGPKADDEPRRISVRDGLAKSDNAVARRLLKDCGPENVVRWARAAGIESKLGADISLALGSYEVTPYELVNAYATIAGGGEYAPPVLIKGIQGPDGTSLPLPERPGRRRVLTAEEAYLTASLMKGVVERGTGRRAKVLGRPLAGKTGTTNDAKDAWFVGFSPDVSVGVWVGYDDPLPLGWGEQGAVTALPAWVRFMKAATASKPAADFPRPPSIVRLSVDPRTGLLPYIGQPDTVEEEFLPGTEPSTYAEPPRDDESGAAKDGDGAGDAGPGDGGAGRVDGAAGADPKPPTVTSTAPPVDPPPF